MNKNPFRKNKKILNHIKLSAVQLEYSKAIEWLLDPLSYRANGRSVLLAYTYINLAIKYPGSVITIRDHFPTHLSDEKLTDTIKLFIRDTDLAAHFVVSLTAIKFII